MKRTFCYCIFNSHILYFNTTKCMIYECVAILSYHVDNTIQYMWVKRRTQDEISAKKYLKVGVSH